jgi:hypothetical protein
LGEEFLKAGFEERYNRNNPQKALSENIPKDENIDFNFKKRKKERSGSG